MSKVTKNSKQKNTRRTISGVKTDGASCAFREKFEAMESGELLPEITEDLPFKHVYDPEVHPDRPAKLLKLLFHEDFFVTGSAREEASVASIYSKKSILDILARLSTQGVANIEMQAVAQDFIVQRSEIYASDLIIMQYSARKNQPKLQISYTNLPTNYVVVLMKESPKLF